MTIKNNQRAFDPLQIDKLGNYIYALRDPRDRKIFYVGQGSSNRLFEHFNEAEQCLKSGTSFTGMSSKVIRILDIWGNEEDVEWVILAHDIPADKFIVDALESIAYDGISESQNGDLLNEHSTPNSTRLSQEEIADMSASPVNPANACTVFVFPIHVALTGAPSVYDATRSAWSVTTNNRALAGSYAVGLQNAISRGSFEIDHWTPVAGSGKHEFESPGHPAAITYAPLLNSKWTKVLSVAKGYWQRGNYLIVEFDGNGKFKVIHGSSDRTTWHDCL